MMAGWWLLDPEPPPPVPSGSPPGPGVRVAGTAGLQKVSGVPGLENVDVSHLVQDHVDYWYHIEDVLQVTPLLRTDRLTD